MTIQHKDIPNAQLHEPKNISGAINREVYVADGVGSGDWRRITDVDVDHSTKANNKYGWNDVSDNLYTSGAPRTILSGVRTQLTNNGLLAATDQSRLGTLWDTTTNNYLINDLNAFYLSRITFTAKTTSAAGTPHIILIEYQSDLGSFIFAGSTQMIKGGSYTNKISSTQGIYIGPAINNTNVKIFVTPDTDITLYETRLIINRTYVEM